MKKRIEWISEDYVKSTWIWRVLVSIWGKKRRRSFSVYLGSSAEFISMIFGSFGKFWIGLCVQKKFSQKNVHRKKSQKLFRFFLVDHPPIPLRFWRVPFISIIKGTPQILKEIGGWSTKKFSKKFLRFFSMKKIRENFF